MEINGLNIGGWLKSVQNIELALLYMAWPITVKNTFGGQRVNWCKRVKTI